MPSPLAHMAGGYAIYRVCDINRPRSGPKLWERVPLLMLATLGLSLLPDVDSAAGILLGDFGGFHNGWTHSLIVGLGVSVVVAGLALFKQCAMTKVWFLTALLCYELHVVMDFFTIGRGVMLFWPLTPARFQSPVKLFYGLHWSDGLVSPTHFWTLLSELGFVVLVALVMHFPGRHMRHLGPVRRSSNRPPKRAPEEG